MNKYKLYIVIDKEEFPAEMTKEYLTEQEAQDSLRNLKDTTNLWIGLENGDMIALNQHLTSNVYFKAKKIL